MRTDFVTPPRTQRHSDALLAASAERLAIPELGPQAHGRVERFFGTTQDQLVKRLRKAGVQTLEEANRYSDLEYLLQ